MSSYPTCTCNAKYVSISTVFHKTEVDEEGICIKCGYYAVYRSEYELFPKSNRGIHGYREVSDHHKPGWGPAEIGNYFSDIKSDHESFAVFGSYSNNLDYSGVGTGSKKSRLKEKNLFNYKLNERKPL